jgi:hypothetical protein
MVALVVILVVLVVAGLIAAGRSFKVVQQSQAELAEDVPDVIFHAPLGDHENPRDRAVGPAFGHQRQHITFPGREGAEPVGAVPVETLSSHGPSRSGSLKGSGQIAHQPAQNQ